MPRLSSRLFVCAALTLALAGQASAETTAFVKVRVVSMDPDDRQRVRKKQTIVVEEDVFDRTAVLCVVEEFEADLTRSEFGDLDRQLRRFDLLQGIRAQLPEAEDVCLGRERQGTENH